MLLRILVATGIVWGLTVLLVIPLARVIQRRWINGRLITHRTEERAHNATPPGPSPAAFIIADVAVLGIAGFVFGISTGWWFVGIAFGRYHWPGLLVFIATSFLGANLHG